MSTPERASIHVIAPGQEAAAASPPGPPPSAEPEAQPPITTPPPQELTKDLGGEASAMSPGPEDLVAASGGSLADQLRARFEGMDATEEFSVPATSWTTGGPA